MNANFIDRYQHKLKTPAEVQAAIGPFPREHKVIMCHGVFDIVHPGHLRHLAYAKSKADVLVASVTADRHITKGIYRPHVPERMRALNLAAFEMVDYVLVDEDPTPIANLKRIQPDFFAKGFEYVASGLPASTQEELATVQAYGGEIIFTPGDFVLSSSRLIDVALPNLGLEKLLLLMRETGLTFDSLRRALDSLQGHRVHVVGDTIVDSYTRTTLIGGQTKTPTFSVLYQGRDDFIGGAGIVAQHLRAAGAEVVFSTVLGDDAFKEMVVDGLGTSGVACRPIVDATRPTTNKNAIIAGGYRLLKVDTVDNRPISNTIRDQLVAAIGNTEARAIVFSDFRHGIFNRSTVPALSAAIPPSMFKVADSQVASRWGNITEFTDFDLITPNEREARFAIADQDSGVGHLAGRITEIARAKMLILKLGERGVFTMRPDGGHKPNHYFSIDTFTNQVADAVGAGDALLAYATLSMLATNSEAVATILGSMAAACECEIDGNVPIRPEDVHAKIDAVAQATGGA
jgi:rfaE bifunctional protein kinase chain/domain